MKFSFDVEENAVAKVGEQELVIMNVHVHYDIR